MLCFDFRPIHCDDITHKEYIHKCDDLKKSMRACDILCCSSTTFVTLQFLEFSSKSKRFYFFDIHIPQGVLALGCRVWALGCRFAT